MFNKFREYLIARKEYNEAKKAITLLLLNQYSELLENQNKIAEEQLKVTEMLAKFNNNISQEELKTFMSDMSKVTSDAALSKDYLSQVSKQAHEQKMAELKVGM